MTCGKFVLHSCCITWKLYESNEIGWFYKFMKKNPTCIALSSNRHTINRHLFIHLYLTEQKSNEDGWYFNYKTLVYLHLVIITQSTDIHIYLNEHNKPELWTSLIFFCHDEYNQSWPPSKGMAAFPFTSFIIVLFINITRSIIFLNYVVYYVCT